ncbi:hypothetical protein K504DRAFT_467648 [Pleomassaria siparia CBS 279.74]|uniref:Exosome complex protein n=1 Tax=Pleomassaria siparia CBS 279.74 TaxID=1314801 RepID=A0A6G1KA50_9PLEO|nr:hypothetical protein K504DRAFT_467648 [Pleomassaria siparia CBS 279.74]
MSTMDPTTDLPERIEDLEAHIDDLETALSPLLSTPLHKTSSTLPLLDKAKLHILSAYAIESLLFSSLLTCGEDAKSHAIFKELGRLKGYFGKIKDAETGPEQRARVDKDAATRFIKHGLSGNERFDRERREREAAKRAAGKKHHIKFDQEAEGVRMEGARLQALAKKRAADVVEDEADEDQEGGKEIDSENAEFYGSSPSAPAPDTASTATPATTHRSKKAKTSTTDTATPAPIADSNQGTSLVPVMTTKEQRRSDRRARKQAEKAEKLAGNRDGKEEEMILPTRAPRTHSETFNALLQGGLPKKTKGRGK